MKLRKAFHRPGVPAVRLKSLSWILICKARRRYVPPPFVLYNYLIISGLFNIYDNIFVFGFLADVITFD